MPRVGLDPQATVADVVHAIDDHTLNSAALGRAALMLAELQDVLDAGPDPEVPNVNNIIFHAGIQMALLEWPGLLVCPVCGGKD